MSIECLGGTILDDEHVEMSKSRPCSEKTKIIQFIKHSQNVHYVLFILLTARERRVVFWGAK